MLYGNQSIAQFKPSNMAIWMAMAFQAGAINIGAFMACHRFVSNVTGFATFFGHEVSQGAGWQALGMLIVPVFFLLGSMLSGQMVDIRLRLHKRPRYYLAFGLIFFLNVFVLLLGLNGFFGTFGEPLLLWRDYLLLVLLCLICGLQNGTITSISNSTIRTTHLTGITTDLGLGIIRFLNRHKLQPHFSNEIQLNLMRIGLIFSFCVGSVLGGFVFKSFEYEGFIVPVLTSGALFFLMLYFQFHRHKLK